MTVEHFKPLPEIAERLTDDDDPRLWDAVCSEILQDLRLRAKQKQEKWPVFLEVGACSHWAAPHQFRTKRAGGFAFPIGYGEDGNGKGRISPKGLPEFDWSVNHLFNEQTQELDATNRTKGRTFLCRVAVPTRTMFHNQAAINVTWIPQPPEAHDTQRFETYGFRKTNDAWECVTAPEFKLPTDKR